MSGGVDSAIAAYLLQQDGWEVIGVTLALWCERAAGAVGGGGARLAGEVCEALGIAHQVIDRREAFRRRVVDVFCDEYFGGRTPNPCILCNAQIKFAELGALACSLGAAAMATGHYARVAGPDDNGRMLLRRGTAREWEQSYFLFGLTQRQLSLVRFPLGTYEKDDVRALARRLRLPVGDGPGSQEICFVPDDDYGGFLARAAPERIRPGRIVDTSGKVLGRHEGIHRFTVGQRRGLGVTLGAPRYVVRIDAGTATVVIGTKEETRRSACVVRDVNWVSIAEPSGAIEAVVKIRYAHGGAHAVVAPLPGGGGARVRFEEPLGAVTPGQGAVFYDGDTVLGGGLIEDVVEG